MAYDAGRDQIILFGGSDNDANAPCDGASSGSSYCSSTWLLDDQGWRQLHPQHSPPPRILASMVYDDAHQRIILFGGESDAGFLGDTWGWDGTDWTPVNSSPRSPQPRSSAAIAYDSRRDQVVLFGGNADGPCSVTWLNDTWELGP
jgi:hypothetical protein